jgi:tRNA (guanine-N7-)-methyltransferase
MRDVFLNRDDSHGLAECMVIVGGRPERFFVHLAQREVDGAIVVRPYPVPRVDARPSVKRMVALVAEALAGADPDVRIAHSTIDEFLSGRWTWQPDPDPAAWDPLLPARGLPRPLDWGAVFGDGGPVEIEIGSGKGTFLVETAEARPDHRFLSIELALPYAEHLRDRVRRRGLRNVRIARADASRFLADHVPPGSVRVLHVYFPDPWPKKRHHKRRLMQPGFVVAAAEALEEGGELRFVSDHAEYFEEATAALAAEPRLETAPVLEQEMTDLTNYERKYHAEGRPIHRARFVKRAT